MLSLVKLDRFLDFLKTDFYNLIASFLYTKNIKGLERHFKVRTCIIESDQAYSESKIFSHT